MLESSFYHTANCVLKTRYKVLLLLFAAPIVALFGIYIYVGQSLPSIPEIRQVQVQAPLRVYSRDEKLIASFGDKQRVPILYEQIPRDMLNAFLAAEDDRFFEHVGVDYEGLVRAAINLIQTGERTQGGSTITMQLARNLFLTKQRTFERKFKEIFTALMLERVFTKEEIFSLYLNKIFFGKRAYGVAAAAEIYYGRTVDELNLPQIAMLAGLPKAPSSYNPLANPDKALERRGYVLGRMLELNMIDQAQHDAADNAPISAERHALKVELQAPYVAEMVRAQIVEEYGPEAYTSSFEVYTTIDSLLQESAGQSLREGLLKYDRRHGWRGTKERLDPLAADFDARARETLAAMPRIGELVPGVVTRASATTLDVTLKDGAQTHLGPSAWRWARKRIDEDRQDARPEFATTVASTGSVVYVNAGAQPPRLAQLPDVAGALVALDTNTGAILALNGGFDFSLSKFNRATQANRQPGSNFKPFIYSAAFAEGYTPASIVIDSPVVFANSHFDWRPENYSGKFFGPTRLRDALKRSRNLISIKLVDDIGIKETLDYIRRFGFERRDHPHNMTLALGSGTVRPLDMARAYAVFANGGFLLEPQLIERIERSGEVLFEKRALRLCNEDCDGMDDSGDMGDSSDIDASGQFAHRAIPADIAYQMTSMMKDVIREGTGRRARALRRSDIAGKTGTTNDQRDAWFSGFNRDIVATVWVGFDDHRPLGAHETGSKAALPIWIDFMRTALDGRAERGYFKPSNIISALIDRDSGLLAHPSDSDGISETFRAEFLPKEIAPEKGDDNTVPEPVEKKLF